MRSRGRASYRFFSSAGPFQRPIDFSRIDLSEFTAEIMANVRMPDVGAMDQQMQSSIQQKVQNYYQR